LSVCKLAPANLLDQENDFDLCPVTLSDWENEELVCAILLWQLEFKGI
jgi:hypothetical protein